MQCHQNKVLKIWPTLGIGSHPICFTRGYDASNQCNILREFVELVKNYLKQFEHVLVEKTRNVCKKYLHLVIAKRKKVHHCLQQKRQVIQHVPNTSNIIKTCLQHERNPFVACIQNHCNILLVGKPQNDSRF
jgi:hypothetical protein